MSRQCRGDAVAIHARAYQRWPLEPSPADRTSQDRLPFSSVFTACAQVTAVPPASVTGKSGATRSTQAWPADSRYSRRSGLAP
jgi:hypothetical protein